MYVSFLSLSGFVVTVNFLKFQCNISPIYHNFTFLSFQVWIYFIASLIICNGNSKYQQVIFPHNIYFNPQIILFN